MLRLAASIFLLLLSVAAPAAAQEMRVFVVTVGPGELPYERFGHNAILFVDPATGDSTAYDWGRFDFNQPNFIGRFVKGHMLYSSGRDPGEQILHFYTDVADRRVVLQELNLSGEQARALHAACEEGYRPENRQYKYDYFIANCSTRLRDVLDEALGGQIQAAIAGVPAGTTFRREAERHLAPHWFIWFGIHAGLARPTDVSISAWEHTFLPEELRRWLGQVEVIDESGRRVPLVKGELELSRGRVAMPSLDAPARWWQTGLIGLAIAGLLVMLSQLRRPKPVRIALAGWFFFAGFAGGFLLWGWLFSGHWAAYRNQTILLFSPLGLVIAATVLAARLDRVSLWLAAAHLALCILGTILHFTPVGQENLGIVSFALPVNAAGAWVLWRMMPARSENEPVPAPALA